MHQSRANKKEIFLKNRLNLKADSIGCGGKETL